MAGLQTVGRQIPLELAFAGRAGRGQQASSCMKHGSSSLPPGRTRATQDALAQGAQMTLEVAQAQLLLFPTHTAVCCSICFPQAVLAEGDKTHKITLACLPTPFSCVHLPSTPPPMRFIAGCAGGGRQDHARGGAPHQGRLPAAELVHQVRGRGKLVVWGRFCLGCLCFV